MHDGKHLYLYIIKNGQRINIILKLATLSSNEIKLFTSKGHVASLDVEIKADFEKIGGFDEDLFLFFEEFAFAGDISAITLGCNVFT